MKDWKQLARGAELDIPAQDLARLEAPLTALENAFRPLVKHLEPHMEPAPVFSAAEADQ